MLPLLADIFANLDRAIALKEDARVNNLRNRAIDPDPDNPPTFCERWDDCTLGYGHDGVCFGLSRRGDR